MVTMGSARAAYKRAHMERVARQLSDEGESLAVEVLTVRKRGSPSFKGWAREELHKQPVLSPKLKRIVGRCS